MSGDAWLGKYGLTCGIRFSLSKDIPHEKFIFQRIIWSARYIQQKISSKDLRNWVLTLSRLDSLDLAMPKNALFPRFKLPVPTVKVKRTNRAAQKNRISEPKAAVKILNLGPCISKIMANISRMEARNTIKRKREKKSVRVKKRKLEEAAKLIAREAWKAKVKQITPILIAPKKTREGKASSFP